MIALWMLALPVIFFGREGRWVKRRRKKQQHEKAEVPNLFGPLYIKKVSPQPTGKASPPTLGVGGNWQVGNLFDKRVAVGCCGAWRRHLPSSYSKACVARLRKRRPDVASEGGGGGGGGRNCLDFLSHSRELSDFHRVSCRLGVGGWVPRRQDPGQPSPQPQSQLRSDQLFQAAHSTS